MKLVCTQSDLNTNLSLVSRAVPARPSHPVLGNVLLIADESKQRIRLRGFDLSLGIETSFPAQVTQGGSITLPAKTLGDIISRLPDGEITVTHEEDDTPDDDTENGGLVTLTSTSGRYQLRSLNAADFPELPTVEDGDSVLLPVESLAEGLRSTLFAASTEETKQVLTGVHVTLGRDAIEFAATDGHRLAVLETPNDRDDDAEANTPSEGLEVTIPARALRELERMLGLRNKEDGVTLHIDAGQVIFELGDDLKLTSRKLEGAYPAYRQLLPTQFTNQVSVDRRKFQSALERIAVLADSRNNVVRCTINQEQQQVQLSVESQDVGSGRESMDATVSSDTPSAVAFNVKYLIDGLKALSSGEITINLNSPTQPVIFTPLSGLKMTYLAMPVQLRDLSEGLTP